MSLTTNRDNIYLIAPNIPYELAERIGDFMEEGFSIFLRAKINLKSLSEGKEMYLFARNGKHCGICVFVHEGSVYVQWVHWFKDADNDEKHYFIRYELPQHIRGEFNNYFVSCDTDKKMISFYVNGILVGNLDYSGKEKISYTDSYIWLGCANMMTDDEFNSVAEIEFSNFVASSKCLSFIEMSSLINSYKKKYTYRKFDYSLPVLDKNTPDLESFKIFCDFEDQSIFKIWNLVNNGNFFQKYIKNNVYY